MEKGEEQRCSGRAKSRNECDVRASTTEEGRCMTECIGLFAISPEVLGTHTGRWKSAGNGLQGVFC